MEKHREGKNNPIAQKGSLLRFKVKFQVRLIKIQS